MRVILYSAALFCATINLVGCDNAAAPTKSQTAASTAQPTPGRVKLEVRHKPPN